MLEKDGLDRKMVLLPRELYTANKALATWEGHTLYKQAVVVKRALQQSCLISPLCLTIYFWGPEGPLEQSGLGFDLSSLGSGSPVVQYLPDIRQWCNAYCKQPRSTLEITQSIYSSEGDTLRLTFTGERLGYMIFNDKQVNPLKTLETGEAECVQIQKHQNMC